VAIRLRPGRRANPRRRGRPSGHARPITDAFASYLTDERHFSPYTARCYGADLRQFVEYLCDDTGIEPDQKRRARGLQAPRAAGARRDGRPRRRLDRAKDHHRDHLRRRRRHHPRLPGPPGEQNYSAATMARKIATLRSLLQVGRAPRALGHQPHDPHPHAPPGQAPAQGHHRRAGRAAPRRTRRRRRPRRPRPRHARDPLLHRHPRQRAGRPQLRRPRHRRRGPPRPRQGQEGTLVPLGSHALAAINRYIDHPRRRPRFARESGPATSGSPPSSSTSTASDSAPLRPPQARQVPPRGRPRPHHQPPHPPPLLRDPPARQRRRPPQRAGTPGPPVPLHHPGLHPPLHQRIQDAYNNAHPRAEAS
jgi:hypothetical protein